ncbi:MAG: response regulator transcription factor [Planctomycetales bacterium]|nr:response regulator transcription factor [Planctomycetales bacterium]
MWHEETILELQPVDIAEDARRRILVLDDEPDHVEVLSTALQRQGFDVVTASSIQAGRLAVDLYHPNLVIMDVGLPDGDGLSFCQSLSDAPETCEIPVIILSGMDRTDIVRQARAAGCQYFLRKPYDPNALLLLARSAIEN